jgi:ABC-type Fe3+/spermidine/putrescine transport system ATPase subunit
VASPRLRLEAVRAAWGREEVVRSVSFDVAEGELLTLLGPNGSGKTTLLRVIAGFERPTGGTVSLDGRDLAGVPPHRRSIGLLLQEPALFPRRTVFDNVAYAPLLQRRSEADVRATVREVSDLLALGPLLDRPSDRLSGGEAQRVALARTLAARPRLVLLDEPFASVDVEVRAGLHAEFRAALRAFGATAIHVTHDREEGLFLGDRLALIFDGRIAAIGAPQEVFAAPATPRIARFLGYNVLPSPDGPTAVLPEELAAAPPAAGEPAYRVRASGPVGRGHLSVLDGPNGERVELRGPEPLPVGSVVALRWTRGVRVRDVPPPPPRATEAG